MRFYCVVLILFIGQLAYSQDWAPLNQVDKYNYQLDTADLITNTLWIDSVTIENGDSVFHLNRILFICDTCTGYGAIRNYPQFLQRKMIKKADGLYNFREHGNLALYTHAAINDTFVFDSINNITATVTGLKDTLLWGNMDSVRTYTLSNNATLVLSKSHGILQFPFIDTTNNYGLVGIEAGRNLGEHVPNFWDFFDFEVGGRYLTSEYFYGVEGGYNKITSFIISDKVTGSNQVIIHRDYKYKYTTYDINFGNYNSYREGSDSIIFKEPENLLVNHYPNQELIIPLNNNSPIEPLASIPRTCFGNIFLNNNNVMDSIITSVKLYIDAFGRKTKSLIIDEYCLPNCVNSEAYYTIGTDTLQKLSAEPESFVGIFKVGIGLFKSLTNSCFEGYGGFEILAYTTMNDTFGTFPPDWFFTSIEPNTTKPPYHLLQNPFTSTLSLTFNAYFEGQVALYSLEGRQVFSQDISGTAFNYNGAELAHGIYILSIQQNDPPAGVAGKTYREKVVKVE